MITCREFVEQLSEFVSDQLPAPLHRTVTQHLRCCSSCHAYLESFRLTVRLARKLPRPPLPERLASSLKSILGTSSGNASATDSSESF
jgi:anti-sigma factor RsiW